MKQKEEAKARFCEIRKKGTWLLFKGKSPKKCLRISKDLAIDYPGDASPLP